MISVSHDFVNKLKELGYTSLTPIQKVAIPIILKGKNTLVIAPTGYGKTEAAVFPVFYKIYTENSVPISALYITPLRALNRDIELRLKKIGEKLGIKVRVRHGDSTESERRRILLDPPQLLLTTPETLLYLVINEKYRKLFENLKWIIIDELQEMLDEKRGYELLIVLERLKRISKNRIQSIGLSATIGNIEIAKKYLGEEVEVAKIDTRKDIDISLIIPELKKDYVDLSIKLGLNPEIIARFKKIEEIVKNEKPVLIFTNVRETTEFLANELSKITQLKILTHHGSLSREVRVEAEKDFREGNIDALVATSSLELGIDIGKINVVLQYMSPRQVIRLVQRIGRSGHSVNKLSKGYIMPSNDIYDILECKAIVDKLKEGYLEKPLIEYKPYDVIAHEIAGMVLEGYNNPREIFDIIKGVFLFSNLTEEEFAEILDILESAKIIKREKDKISPSFRLWKYYYETNMIPDSLRDYLVIDHVTNSKIGTLDEEFISALDENTVFVLGGKLWKVVTIEDGKVYVEQAQLKSGILPSWFGESIPVEKEIALKVYEYISRIAKGEEIDLPKDVLNKLKDIVDNQLKRGYPLPSDKEILVEINHDLIVIHSAFGTRGNNTLGAIISALLSRLKGIKANYRSDSYHIAIATVIPIYKDDIIKIVNMINSLQEKDLEELLKIAIKESPQFKWKLLVEAERFGVIDKGKDIDISSTLLRPFIDTIVGEEAVKELIVKNYDLSILSNELRKVSWKILEVPSFSPLAKEFLDKLLVFRSSEDKPIMLEVYKRKLLSKEVKLICMVCGWNSNFNVSQVPPRCPKCGSVFLTVVDLQDNESIQIVKKAIKGEKLSKKELKKLEELKRISSFYSYYNKYVAIGLSAPGVGVTNISKALEKLREGEDKYYEALLDLERRFIRTRKYWH
ncbi:DEAD/DEAH box helicase [Sulfurisphaera ohwakuensis]|uniref:ATP-dependent Lhr-like helicase n=1 Tax=Sulfurisphaera ohwakuensis TaxID=69656 RepID=A0A650CEF2_SULOH|nr:DEAD/DEAH box helicase [Sulfurisphaera ohwakuensis]MBB5253031.1 ATP-dependent Lhr-like helicase [Sulfurisphaera ohwakuensis]QGR16045.1 DEAD/DEAH box helicase [Sulfurisphaera ohwakuensis]